MANVETRTGLAAKQVSRLRWYPRSPALGAAECLPQKGIRRTARVTFLPVEAGDRAPPKARDPARHFRVRLLVDLGGACLGSSTKLTISPTSTPKYRHSFSMISIEVL